MKRTTQKVRDLDALTNPGGRHAKKGRMPALFIGHGSPMNAIEDNNYTRAWQELGRILPRPSAILCISAHWLTRDDTRVTAAPKPDTIHDFVGFPEELYRQQYAAPGAPAWAEQTRRLLAGRNASLDHARGIDHGTWSVLLRMFPRADIPVYQVSIDYSRPPEFHFDLGRQMRPLREHGVLIIGSGNIVHNLMSMKDSGGPYDWALEFDDLVARHLQDGDRRAIVDFLDLGTLATIAHPTYDHFLPLLYTIGLQEDGETAEFPVQGIALGSVSMRSVLFR